MKKISLYNVRRILDSKVVCSFKCWKNNGEVMECKNVRSTSSNYRLNTINIKFIDSGEIRKIRAYNIFEFNNKEVMI